VWVSVWLSADGALKRITAASMRAIFLATGASLPLICLGFVFLPCKYFKRKPFNTAARVLSSGVRGRRRLPLLGNRDNVVRQWRTRG